VIAVWYIDTTNDPNTMKNPAAVHDALFSTAQYEYVSVVSVVPVGTSSRCNPRNNEYR